MHSGPGLCESRWFGGVLYGDQKRTRNGKQKKRKNKMDGGG